MSFLTLPPARAAPRQPPAPPMLLTLLRQPHSVASAVTCHASPLRLHGRGVVRVSISPMRVPPRTRREAPAPCRGDADGSAASPRSARAHIMRRRAESVTVDTAVCADALRSRLPIRAAILCCCDLRAPGGAKGVAVELTARCSACHGVRSWRAILRRSCRCQIRRWQRRAAAPSPRFTTCCAPNSAGADRRVTTRR